MTEPELLRDVQRKLLAEMARRDPRGFVPHVDDLRALLTTSTGAERDELEALLARVLDAS